MLKATIDDTRQLVAKRDGRRVHLTIVINDQAWQMNLNTENCQQTNV